MTRAVTRLGSLLALAALTSVGWAARPWARRRPRIARRAGFAPVVSWEGGVTVACWTPVGETDAEVRVRWDGRRYDYDPGRGRTGAGQWPVRDLRLDLQLRRRRPGRSGREPDDEPGRVRLPARRLAGRHHPRGRRAGPHAEPVRRRQDYGGSARAAEHDRAGSPCVSKKEFRKIKRGMTPGQVQKVVGAKGRKVTGASYRLVQRYRPVRGFGERASSTSSGPARSRRTRWSAASLTRRARLSPAARLARA